MKSIDRLIRPSSRAFFRHARQTPGYSLVDWLHGYVYSRWPYLYISIGTGEHPLARCFGPLVRGLARVLPKRRSDVTFADTYHGKVVPLEAAGELVTVEREIHVADLEHVIPYARARAIVLHNPDHIAVLECPCRAARTDPCLPLDVCLVIGEPFASFVVEHHPRRARWISQAEALDVLRAEAERGHVHHAFFKDAMLDRFYAICNCCACCCGAMQAHRAGTPMLASSGYVSRVDPTRCVGCGACVEICPFEAMTLDDENVRVDEGACMGCGVCVDGCAQSALSLVRDPARGEPLEVRGLEAGS